MVDTSQPKGKVPLKSFLADLRSAMTDAELREKYDLSARSFVSLIKALLIQNLVTPDDLARRKQMAEKRDLARESHFLSQLFICPHCGHPHPSAFNVCPACGFSSNEADDESSLDLVTATAGGHIYVSETRAQPAAPSGDAPEEPEDDSTGSETTEGKSKPTAMESVRSLISRITKK
jgi:hypothetical protein